MKPIRTYIVMLVRKRTFKTPVAQPPSSKTRFLDLRVISIPWIINFRIYFLGEHFFKGVLDSVHKRNIFMPSMRNLRYNLYIDLKKKKSNLWSPLFPKKLLPEANSDGKYLKNVNQNVDLDIIEWFCELISKLYSINQHETHSELAENVSQPAKPLRSLHVCNRPVKTSCARFCICTFCWLLTRGSREIQKSKYVFVFWGNLPSELAPESSFFGKRGFERFCFFFFRSIYKLSPRFLASGMKILRLCTDSSTPLNKCSLKETTHDYDIGSTPRAKNH